MGLGFAAFGAELPELEARCHEHLHYARPTVLAATEDPQGTRVLNLFARDCLYKPSSSVVESGGGEQSAAKRWQGSGSFPGRGYVVSGSGLWVG